MFIYIYNTRKQYTLKHIYLYIYIAGGSGSYTDAGGGGGGVGSSSSNSNDGNTTTSNNLNINLPEHNAVLRLEVELRDKHTRRPRNNKVFMVNRGGKGGATNHTAPISNLNNYFVPLEKVSNRT